MFNHILLPTDGSIFAQHAMEAGLAFAKEHGARVTIYHAVEPLPPYVWTGGVALAPGLIERLEKEAQRAGEAIVSDAAELARKAGVDCRVDVAQALSPHEGILDAAQQNQCDGIFMSSHGRTGLANLLLGSVTQKVLLNARVPVVVYPARG
jgi:nucleotide-binding universal stress UspA family protein